MGLTQSKAKGSSSSGGAFRAIADNFQRLDQVQAALRGNGLESSNLIVAVDFTKSNEWTGRTSFGGRSLHWLGHQPNPYEQAISIVAKTLAAFDDDGLIPCYGFGDSTTADHSVFSFYHGNMPAHGLDALLLRYKELVPHVRLAGPTSFAPAIQQAMKLVVESGNQYHILVLVADGQVTRSVDMPRGQVSTQEKATIDAIVEASSLPLSIVMIGVGDGPWDVMKEFDDLLPQRRFDNFQFVEYTSIAARYSNDPQRLEAVFATSALMEIPDQFKIIQRLNLLGSRTSVNPRVRCLDPPGPRPMQTPGAAFPPYGSFGPGAPVPAYSVPQPGYGAPPQYQHSASFQHPGAFQQPHVSPYPASSYQAAPGYPEKAQTAVPAPAAGGTSAGASSSNQVDAMFICPITHELMKDPVVAADGHTYDRESITQWLKTHDTSPMTGAKLPHKTLTPNHTLRSTIMDVTKR